jgi:hypothetical protein
MIQTSSWRAQASMKVIERKGGSTDSPTNPCTDPPAFIQKERSMVLTISDEEFVRMQTAVLDGDKQEALQLIRDFVKRLELQKRQGLKSHLD